MKILYHNRNILHIDFLKFLQKKIATSCNLKNKFFGAGGRTRTGTELPPRDFKSLVSTISPPRQILSFGKKILEAPPRFGLGVKVLQTSALPLGYGAIFGGNNRARTYDPLRVKQMLSQLSYAPIKTILR